MLFVGLALSGCVQSDGPTDDDTADAPRDPVTFHTTPPTDRPAVQFRVPVDLGSKAGPMDLGVGAVGTSCDDSLDDGDCGLGEPSVEVDGAGTIYVTGVCCLNVAPPIYVSRDGGVTFEELTTDTGVREAFGIEGDFAIDQEGRMYFADIEFAGTFQVTVWEADGTYVRHTKWPAPPLVDRDWIRAEGDGIVYYVYNTGAAGTNVYKSTDAGLTWSPAAIYTAEYALGNVAIDPGVELCLFGGSLDGHRRLDCTSDGGDTWRVEASSLPAGDGAYPVGAYDEAGTLWLADYREAEGGGQEVYVTHRSADGAWSEDVLVVSPPDGFHRMPWLAAGADGSVAIAWYGKDGGGSEDGDWYLYAAATKDHGAHWDVVHADPDPVFQGVLGRDLLDFLQVDIGPDGGVHIAYSDQWVDGQAPGPDGNEEQLRYVRSEPSPLAMSEFWLGPSTSANGEGGGMAGKPGPGLIS